MAENFKSSFIPKEPLRKERPRKKRGETNIVSLIATIVFILTLLSAGGVFAYKNFLERSLQNKAQALSEARSAFDTDLIEELTRLDRRLKTAEDLLNQHVAVSRVFEELENSTSQAVRFTNFAYTSGREAASISLSGQSGNFVNVAHQSDVLGANRWFRNVIFSNLRTNDFAEAEFTFSADLNPELIKYQVGSSDTSEQTDNSQEDL